MVQLAGPRIGDFPEVSSLAADDALEISLSGSTGSRMTRAKNLLYSLMVATGLGVVSITHPTYGADSTGTTDSTAAIQSAVNSGKRVLVPEGSFRVDGAISLPPNCTFLVLGTLRRYSAFSASTRPILMIQGDFVTVVSMSLQGTLMDDNNSPDGVLLYGTEAPSASSPVLAIRWATVQGLRIICNANTASKGIAMQSAEGYGVVSACYDGHFLNCKIFSPGTGIYLNTNANGNTIKMMNFFDVKVNAIFIDGRSAGGTNITSGVGVDDVFVDGSVSMNGAIVKARHANTCKFTNIRGEPGSVTAKLWDVDDTNFKCDLDGTDNCVAGSTIPTPGLANANTVVLNGKFYGDDFIGPVSGAHTGSGSVSAATATFTSLFSMVGVGRYLVHINLGAGAPAYLGSCDVTWDGSSNARLFNKDVGANVDFQVSGDAVQAKQTSGITQPISYAYLRIGTQ